MKKLVLLAVSFFLLSCADMDIRYDNKLHSDITNLTYELVTTGMIGDETVEMMSNSFHIGKGYILTAKHCISLYYRGTDAKNYKYFIDGREIKLIGKEADTALLYDEGLIGKPYIKFGNSDRLRIGDEVILIGNSLMAGMNIKSGIVSRLSIKAPLFGLPQDTVQGSFIMDTPSIGGDSGGPVLASQYGEYYLIGMIYANLRGGDGYTICFKSNYLKALVEKFKNA